MPYLLIDICGTLFFSNTTFDFLDFIVDNPRYRLLRRTMRCRPCRMINSVVYRIAHIDLFRRLALKNLKGINRNTLLLKADIFYDLHLASCRNKAVFNIIDNLRGQYTPLLVSATIGPVAEVIGERENIAVAVSSELGYHNGICTGRLATDRLHSKAAALTSLSIMPPYGCIITDNPADAPIVRQSQKAYIVCYNNEQRWHHLLPDHHDITFINIDDNEHTLAR